MEFRHIFYFIKVAQCKNITKAADALFISQQALSKCLKGLEEELHVRLISRKNHGIDLTQDGLYLYERFHDICDQYTMALDDAFEHFNLRQGQIEFAVSNGFFRSISINHLIKFTKMYPQLELEQLEHPDLDCEDYVRSDKHHFALSTKPWNQKGLEYHPIHREQLQFIAHKNHPLANRTGIYMNELSEESFLFFSKRYNIHFRTMEGCKKHGFKPNVIYKSSDVSQLVKLTNQNQGILICVKHVYEESSHENLVCIPILDEDMYWELGLIYQDFNSLNKNQKLFIQYLLSEFEKN
ncbi:MAG: LysR family transcriptional regulator [Eubacteriales bacterium]|nr:LysR family transcriptional regulator [Eubacteriales bacterium]